MLVDSTVFKKQAERRTKTDKLISLGLFVVALFCASIIIFTIGFILVKGLEPFVKTYTINGEEYRVDFWSFLFGNSWLTGVDGYGAGYLIINTLYISFLTCLLSAPISIFTALVIVRMADKRIGELLSSSIELLAGVPSVIFGMFGMGQITNWTKSLASSWPFFTQTAGGLSVLTSVLVLTMMSVPTITMLSITAIRSVNKNIISGSLALGASAMQTNYRLVLSSSRSGIVAGIILGIDRALGEATAVTLVCGNAGNGPSFSLFSTTRTLSSSMLLGFSDAFGLNYDIRFSLGLLLIVLILIVNLFLEMFQKRIRR